MSYIGRGVDAISNVEKLDNITFNGGTTYALTKSSAAFTPVGANNILVSIDGVIQQGNFSVSTTNIVFDFSPTSSNTCDFVLHYGTGVLNVPADGSVSLAKMASNSVDSDQYVDGSIDAAHIADDQVTLAKMAGLARGKIIYGDASGNPAALTVGSNTQVLKSDGTDISWGADAGFDVSTITGATALATEPATTDEIILSDAGTLKRMDFAHIMQRPRFSARMTSGQTIATATATDVIFDQEINSTTAGTSGDPDGTYDTSNGRWTPAVAGWYSISWTVGCSALDDGERLTGEIFKNGTYFAGDATSGGQLHHRIFSSGTNQHVQIHGTHVIPLDSDDYVHINITHNEGADVTLDSYTCHFYGHRIIG
ncbi:hypothetical protein [uncultured Mediterranean phage]|nr:hypothetical protein [uncultured Mediterranean phage]